MNQQLQLPPVDIAVASYDKAWLGIAARYLYEHKSFGTCHYVQRADRLLSVLKVHPEIQVLVLDEQLQDMDLVEFLEVYNTLSLTQKPMLIAMCSNRPLGYTGNLYAQGVMDCIAKPIHLNVLSKRVLRLYHEQCAGRVKTFCETLYESWGITQSDSTLYLTDAVKILSDSNENLAVRKELIWEVAEIHACSNSAVDSGLRRLIDKLEKTNTLPYCSFKELAGLQGQKPTVGQLVYAMREALQKETYVMHL